MRYGRPANTEKRRHAHIRILTDFDYGHTLMKKKKQAGQEY